MGLAGSSGRASDKNEPATPSRRREMVTASTHSNVLPLIIGFSLILVLARCAGGAGGQAVSTKTSAPVPPTNAAHSASLYWQAPALGSVNSLGAATWPIDGNGTATLLTPSIGSTYGPLICKATSWDPPGKQLTITYGLGSAYVRVTLQVQPSSTGVSVRLTADAPAIASVDLGPWNSTLSATSLPVPYYTGSIWYSRQMSAFLNSWWDWRSTHASAFHSTEAKYCARTDGIR